MPSPRDRGAAAAVAPSSWRITEIKWFFLCLFFFSQKTLHPKLNQSLGFGASQVNKRRRGTDCTGMIVLRAGWLAGWILVAIMARMMATVLLLSDVCVWQESGGGNVPRKAAQEERLSHSLALISPIALSGLDNNELAERSPAPSSS